MRTRANAKEKRNSNKGWGTGFFFIFFPEDDSTIITNNDNKNTNLFSINTSLRSSNSTLLLSKAQFTLSICALFIFITLLLFTLSTFEPSTSHHFPSSKHLFSSNNKSNSSFQHALQGMGSLYIKGTRAMNVLIIAHLTESVSVNELKLFTRLFYKSKLASKSDLLFIFQSKSNPFDKTIAEEHNSFLKLLHNYNKNNSTSNFYTTQFNISNKKANESAEAIWGRKIHSNFSDFDHNAESTRLSYGSVIGFYADELDPENSLSGFLDNVPMNLRRWACYPMLLGRIRRNFKHIMLVDMKEILLLGDSLSRLKNMGQDSVLVSTITQSTVVSKHEKKKLEKTQANGKKLASTAIIIGGSRGVRRLSNAMLTEIVREALERKKKNSVTESVLFNQLVGNEFILKNVELIFDESIAELSSLVELDKKSGSSLVFMSKFSIVRRGNSNVDVCSFFRKYFRSMPFDSTAYGDC